MKQIVNIAHYWTQEVKRLSACTDATDTAYRANIDEIRSHTAPAASRAATAMIEHVAPAPVSEYIAPSSAVTSDAHSQQLPPVYTATTVTSDVNLDTTDLVHPQFSSQVVGSLPPLDEFDAPVYSQIHQEQIVAGMTIAQEIPEVPVVERIQEQKLEPIEVLPQARVIVQEIPEVPLVERIQEQNVETIDVIPQERAVPDLVSPQISTSVEASQVVGSIPPLEDFAACRYNQVHQEQIVATVSAVPELMNPPNSITADETPQVVGSFPPLEDFAACMYKQVHQEQIVATVQEQMNVQDTLGTQVVERIQNKIVDSVTQEPDQCTFDKNARVSFPQEPVLGQEIPELQVVEQILVQAVEAMEARLFARLQEFNKRLDMSEARREEIGVLWEKKQDDGQQNLRDSSKKKKKKN